MQPCESSVKMNQENKTKHKEKDQFTTNPSKISEKRGRRRSKHGSS